MGDTLRMVGGLIYLVLAIGGTVFGWVLVGRIRRWRHEQVAMLPVVHQLVVAQRQQVLAQAFELDRQVQDAASRLDTGARDVAALPLGKLIARMTGREPGFWAPMVARMLVSQVAGGEPDGGRLAVR